MIELPEAVVLSTQIQDNMMGRQVEAVTVLHSPHKFAWFHGEPGDYPGLLAGETITGAESHGGMVHIHLGKTSCAHLARSSRRQVPPT